MNLNPVSKKGMGFLSFTKCGRRRDKEIQPRIYMEKNLERCLKCGKQEGLQGVAVTIGRRTFHLFYLCAKCGNVDIGELLKIIRWYKEKRKT
jgi:hypothetical protein